jgi:hypothetical protein
MKTLRLVAALITVLVLDPRPRVAPAAEGPGPSSGAPATSAGA